MFDESNGKEEHKQNRTDGETFSLRTTCEANSKIKNIEGKKREKSHEIANIIPY